MKRTETSTISPISPASDKEAEYRELPYNLEAEQALLGALLVDNEQLHKVSDYLLAEHFYRPVHQRIFEAIWKYNERALLANPVTLKSQFDGDEELKESGGAGYLAKLAGLAAGIFNINDYGRTIYELAISRGLIHLGKDIVEEAYDQTVDMSPSEQIELAESRLFGLASDGSSDKNFQPLKIGLTDAIKRAEHAFKMKDQVSGVPSGFIDMDQMLGGLQDSDLVILAGRPSMGKTALAVNLGFNSALAFKKIHEAALKNDDVPDEPVKSVGIFSLEMSSEQLAARLLSMQSGISSNNIRRGRLNDKAGEFEKLVEANRELYDLPLYIDDTPALSIAAIRTRARRLKRKHNLGLLVVDYLQLLRGTSAHSQSNRVQEVSEITQGLKAIAKELNIPVLALSQLSRAVEQRDDKRPHLSDLRESGSIEQDADIVMFIYREQYYLERSKPPEGTSEAEDWKQKNGEKWLSCKNKAEVIISKHRNGPIGNVFLMFEGETTSFKDLDQQHQSDADFAV
jgi:replicative DNA helicase